jgi:hypothetical protein
MLVSNSKKNTMPLNHSYITNDDLERIEDSDDDYEAIMDHVRGANSP